MKNQGGKSKIQAQNSKFSQKHAQYAFSSKLKQQKCHNIWKKSIRKIEICKNQANFN